MLVNCLQGIRCEISGLFVGIIVLELLSNKAHGSLLVGLNVMFFVFFLEYFAQVGPCVLSLLKFVRADG
jgi:hypothetical protein